MVNPFSLASKSKHYAKYMQPGEHKVLMPSVKDHLSMAQPGTVIYLVIPNAG